tara:strand:- start:272 stop:1216 length:945 start_codon:yes stop_codon:yes gene_type:complete
MKNKVYITDYISNPSVEKRILGDSLSDSLSEKIEVILVWHQLIDKNYIESLPNLKGIIRYGVGFDSIDIDYAKSKKIYVCNTPDYGTDEVSDTAISMIMNIARGVSRYDFRARHFNKNWQENTISNLRRNNEIKLGVIGAGRIGSSVILKSNALKFNTSFYDPLLSRGYEKTISSKRYDSLDEILKNSDIVSINCPLNDKTFGMIDSSFIKKMKDGASLVNTARGKIILDLECIYNALKSNKLSNVALDVLPNEPPENSKLINAWKKREDWLDGRLIINPHTAYYSLDAFDEMRTKASLNALRILNNQSPYNII